MPYLIAIEGIDGAGKGTQAKMLVKNLQGLAMTVETMSFPAYEETEGAKLVARYLNGEFGDVAPELAAMMFAMDRFENRDRLKLNLENNDAVVLDRYVWSNIAHQTERLKYQPEISRQWQRIHFENWVQTVEFDVFKLPRPSVTVLVDIPVDLAIERIAKKTARKYTDKAADLHESDRGHLQFVADMYRDMAVRHEWSVVRSVKPDGTPKAVEEVSAEILLNVLRSMGQAWRLDPQWEFNRVDIAKAIHQTWSQNPWDKSSEACRQDSLNSADVAIAEMIKQLSQKGA